MSHYKDNITICVGKAIVPNVSVFPNTRNTKVAMAAKYLVFIGACLILALKQVSAQEVVNEKIKVTVGTASGCSDTVSFISNHLVEAYRLYGEFLDIEFVPWGRTQWVDGVFTCQFREPDCWANRLHRCVLNMLKDNQDAQVHYMACEFSSPFPSFVQGSYLCAQAVGLNLIAVDYCVSHPGDELDEKAQAAAQAPMQPGAINFVPYIMFNDVISRPVHDEARIRFVSMICFALAADPSTGVTNCQI